MCAQGHVSHTEKKLSLSQLQHAHSTFVRLSLNECLSLSVSVRADMHKVKFSIVAALKQSGEEQSKFERVCVRAKKQGCVLGMDEAQQGVQYVYKVRVDNTGVSVVCV